MDDLAESLRFVKNAPIAFGPWQRLKSLYKTLEADPASDPELFGTLLARLDDQPLTQEKELPTVSGSRLGGLRCLNGLAIQGDLLLLRGSTRLWGGQERLVLLKINPDNHLSPELLASINVDGVSNAGLLPGGKVWTLSGNDLDIWRREGESLQKVRSLTGVRSVASSEAHFVVYREGEGGPRVATLDGDGAEIGSVATPEAQEDEGGVWPGDTFALVAVKPSLARGALTRILGGGSPKGLAVIDLSDPKKPRLASTVPLNADISAVACEGTNVVVATRKGYYEHRLLRVDLSDLERPKQSGSVEIRGYCAPDTMAARGGVVYLHRNWMGVHLFVLEGSGGKPEPVTGIRQIPGGVGLALAGEFLYAASTDALSVWSLLDPRSPKAYGTPPTPKTLAYMKRRARRALKSLARTDSERYGKVVCAMFQAQSGPLELSRHWASLDVLFGGGGRLGQQSHGRGKLYEIRPRGLSIRRREERHPELFDAYPDLMRTLYGAPKAPWQAREMALKSLRFTRAALPVLKGAALEAALTTPSPLLAAFAIRQVAEKGGSPAALALAYLKASPKLRPAIAAHLDGLSEDNARNIARTLLAPGGNLSQRRRTAGLKLLAARYAALVAPDDFQGVLGDLLGSDDASLISLALWALERTEKPREWLAALNCLPAEIGREEALLALESAVRGRDFSEDLWYLYDSADAFLREASWRLALASGHAETLERAAEIWRELLDSYGPSDELRTALSSPHALALLSLSGISASEIVAAAGKRPFLVGLLSPETFAGLAASAPAETTLALIAAASDDDWERLKGGWVRSLIEGVGTDALWRAAEKAIRTDETGRLEARLLGDEAVASTLLSVEDCALVLSIREAAFGPILGRYAARHAAKISGDDALLLLAATHPLAELRTPALEWAKAQAMRLPFALRLLECELPASAALGAAWFETDAGGEPLVRAMALCDSPVPSVRAHGQSFIERHRAELDLDRVCAALFEHYDPGMQDFAARLSEAGDAPLFDAEVLRARNRARRAKERVKKRQSARPTLDTATLLSMARDASTPRDAEWALQQLTRRALSGERIEGLTVE